jgi:hypothetical protein
MNYTITIINDDRDSHSICDKEETLFRINNTKQLFVSTNKENFINWICKSIVQTILLSYIREHGHEKYDSNCQECERCFNLGYDYDETNVDYYDANIKHEITIKNFNELSHELQKHHDYLTFWISTGKYYRNITISIKEEVSSANKFLLKEFTDEKIYEWLICVIFN